MGLRRVCLEQPLLPGTAAVGRLSVREERLHVRKDPVDVGQDRVLDGHAGDARGLQFLHRAHDVQRVPVAVVGVGDHRQAGDAASKG